MKIDTSLITDVVIEDVEMGDYPDFSNAFISGGSYPNGVTERDLTEAELDFINSECSEFVHEQAHETLH